VARERVEKSPVRSGNAAARDAALYRICDIPVAKIRPEAGLGRKRDREGHKELQRSIQQFGVLTPITVRPAPDSSGEYLLIKGQGRTLACSLLGLRTIPAIIVDDTYAETEKVQQFLVENVARLRMRPIDRALLITHARQQGEETAEVARRFGVSAATVRRLEVQLNGASAKEVAALRSGDVNLAKHAVIARWVTPKERVEAIALFTEYSIKTTDMTTLFEALGWDRITNLGPQYKAARLRLLRWVCAELSSATRGPLNERLNALAVNLPLSLESQQAVKVAR
jgi:ParB/RepB/Spo0J family partition protein